MIDAYIINLKRSVDRKKYMMSVMDQLPFFRMVFVDGVDGRSLTTEEIRNSFSRDEAYRHYGRELIPAEIGCTLSHRKCAQALLDSDKPYALVLEDDVIWREASFEPVLHDLDPVLNLEEPVAVLLSGDYWYKKKTPINANYELADIWDAVCAQAYLLNRAAAKTILNMECWYLADDWYEIRRQGVVLKALFPHVADQNRSDVHTVIAEKYGGLKRENLSRFMRIRSYWRSFVDKLLVWTDHFEAKNFKW